MSTSLKFIKIFIDSTQDAPVQPTSRQSQMILSKYGDKARDWHAKLLDRCFAGNHDDVFVKTAFDTEKLFIYEQLIEPDILSIRPRDHTLLVIASDVEATRAQIAELTAKGITCLFVNGPPMCEEEKTWSEINSNKFRIVFMTPQIAFSSGSARHLRFRSADSYFDSKPDKFVASLRAVILDCPLMPDWEGVKLQFGSYKRLLSNLGPKLKDVPIVCFSPHLTCPNKFIHATSLIPTPKIGVSNPLSINNVNILVTPISNLEKCTELFQLLKGVTNPAQIPKTMIFLDDIDEGVRIARSLRHLIKQQIAGHSGEIVVRTCFNTIDCEALQETFRNFKDGTTRIVFCLEDWSLSLDDPDIDVVIQWKVRPELDISTLYHRIGKCARNGKEGVAVVYVQKDGIFMKPRLEKWLHDAKQWEEAWSHPERFEPLGHVPQSSLEDQQDNFDGLLQRARFGLAVTPSTLDNMTHQIWLFCRENNDIQNSYNEAVRTQPYPRRKKFPIDPAVLSFLFTRGCRHALFRFLFNDAKLFDTIHGFWCCDSCAIANGREKLVVTGKFSPSRSILKMKIPENLDERRENEDEGQSSEDELLETRLMIKNIPDEFFSACIYGDTAE